MYLLKLSQSPIDGALTVDRADPIELGDVKGAWNLCAGSVTPWTTHLGGEEYEPDGAAFSLATCVLTATCGTSIEAIDPEGFPTIKDFVSFVGFTIDGTTTVDQLRAAFNPYRYGMAIEVQVGSSGEGEAKKWFTLGRHAKELSYVMPDRRTVYSTDDGDRVGFFKFVATRPGDLSSGSLYAAKMTQLSDVNGGNFTVEWVLLGTNTQASLEAAVNNLKFSDMFEISSPVSPGVCNTGAGFKSVNVGNMGFQCLKLKAGMQNIAAFFETRRMAAYLGATVEFSKWEGFTYSPKRKSAFTSMSEIRRGMEDNKKGGVANTAYDIGGPNHIRLPWYVFLILAS